MFIEKKRKGVSPRLFTANGTTNGVVTLADTTDLFVKQIIYLASNTQQPRELEIKRFVNENSFKVGPRGSSITAYSDVSDLLVADGAILSAPEQDRPGITEKEHERAVYAEEPIVAKRVIQVDEFGDYYNTDNRLPVDIGANIDFDGDINVDMDGFDSDEPDSVQITGSVDGSKAGQKYGFVNNVRLQILSAHDRQQEIVYADFGTKNQRVIQIDYTSATFPGIIARKTINYTLVGNRYRRDEIIWSIL